MLSIFRKFKYSVGWNLMLLTIGSLMFVVGVNGVVVHNTFITGGLYGACLLIYYKTGWLSPGLLYLILNIPLCIAGWILVSRRFVIYSVYAILVLSLGAHFITLDFGIEEQIYAAIAGGFICGAGNGIILRSIGSAGGLDIVAIILNKYLNLGIGKFFMIFNCVLFLFVVAGYSADIFIASILLVFISSRSLDYFLSLFNQRKVVYVISDLSEEIADVVINKLKIGATFIQAKGAYSGQEKNIVMAIANNLQMKRLEEAVFTVDADALFIVENSYDVIGSNFRKRKIY
jgi:uncharacterized membrane-anchored protein YitT (DUF2179 family)